MNTSISDVFLGNQKIGSLLRLPGERITFSFDDSYLNDSNRPVLSLSYFDTNNSLIQSNEITQVKAPSFFSNLLPEGHLREYIADKANIKSARDFPLLNLLGEDLPGNIYIRPSSGKETEENINIESDGSEDNLHFSLAGVQLKLSAVMEATGGLTIPTHGSGGDWILKLPSMQFPNVPENEFFMMQFAAKLGLDVPEVKLIDLSQVVGLPDDLPYFSGKRGLAIKRFDRTSKGRVHFEDFAQVYGIYPRKKYEGVSYNNIANTIYQTMTQEDLNEFIKRLVFSVMIGNGDMHLKNWAVIYKDGKTPSLAPGYDFLSTVIYMPNDKLGLTLGKTKVMQDVSLNDFEYMVKKFNLPANTVDIAKAFYEQFLDLWPAEKKKLNIEAGLVVAIERHVKTTSFN